MQPCSPALFYHQAFYCGLCVPHICSYVKRLFPLHSLHMQFCSPSEAKNLPQGIFWQQNDDHPEKNHHPSRDNSTSSCPPSPPCHIIMLQAAPSIIAANLAAAPRGRNVRPAVEPPPPQAQQQVSQRVLKPSEYRSLQWHAWARTVARIDGTW